MKQPQMSHCEALNELDEMAMPGLLKCITTEPPMVFLDYPSIDATDEWYHRHLYDTRSSVGFGPTKTSRMALVALGNLLMTRKSLRRVLEDTTGLYKMFCINDVTQVELAKDVLILVEQAEAMLTQLVVAPTSCLPMGVTSAFHAYRKARWLRSQINK